MSVYDSMVLFCCLHVSFSNEHYMSVMKLVTLPVCILYIHMSLSQRTVFKQCVSLWRDMTCGGTKCRHVYVYSSVFGEEED